MFDDKPNIKQSPVDEIIQSQTQQNNSATVNSPNVIPPSLQPNHLKKEEQEPEDIFGTSDPVTPPVISAQTSSSSQAADNNNTVGESDDLADEPVIKNAPSVFKKLASTPVITKTPSDKGAMPPLPTTPQTNNKNIIIFIILILVILSLAAVAYWFFILRVKAPSGVMNNPVELFKDQSPNTNSETVVKEDNQNNNSDSSAQDTDGDGLYDEAEILLGTSIDSSDTDNDGLSDKDEVKIYKTDPLKQDTDDDGWLDSEEIINNTNPLEVDAAPVPDKHYVNKQYKLSFDLLPEMVFESASNKMLQFNDNVNQIKFYIYLAGIEPNNLTPDVSYIIGEDTVGNLVIQSSQSNEDSTPYSTDLSTVSYQAHNGLTYLMRYVATKRADNHLKNFEQLLNSFNFKQ